MGFCEGCGGQLRGKFCGECGRPAQLVASHAHAPSGHPGYDQSGTGVPVIPPTSRRRGRRIFLASVMAVLVVGGGAGAAFVVAGGDDQKEPTVLGASSADEALRATSDAMRQGDCTRALQLAPGLLNKSAECTFADADDTAAESSGYNDCAEPNPTDGGSTCGSFVEVVLDGAGSVWPDQEHILAVNAASGWFLLPLLTEDDLPTRFDSPREAAEHSYETEADLSADDLAGVEELANDGFRAEFHSSAEDGLDVVVLRLNDDSWLATGIQELGAEDETESIATPSPSPEGTPSPEATVTADEGDSEQPEVDTIFTGSDDAPATPDDAETAAIMHPTFGPAAITAFQWETDSGEKRGTIRVNDEDGSIRWEYTNTSGMYEFALNETAIDEAGNIFINYNPGRYNGVIVLRPIADGFEDFGSLPEEDGYDARFYYAEVRDEDRDGELEIVASENDCDPSCAGGTTTSTAYEWTGSDYAAQSESSSLAEE